MTAFTRFAATGLLALSATACVENTHSTKAMVDAMSSCEKVNALIKSHSDGFSKIRTNKSITPRIDIWKARYHLVGDSCQVWGLSDNRFDYVCSATAPTEYVARQWYEKAKIETDKCLDDSWTMSESPRSIGNGDKAVFSQKNSDLKIATHVIETRGLFKSEWATYYFVGNSQEEL